MTCNRREDEREGKEKELLLIFGEAYFVLFGGATPGAREGQGGQCHSLHSMDQAMMSDRRCQALSYLLVIGDLAQPS